MRQAAKLASANLMCKEVGKICWGAGRGGLGEVWGVMWMRKVFVGWSGKELNWFFGSR